MILDKHGCGGGCGAVTYFLGYVEILCMQYDEIGLLFDVEFNVHLTCVDRTQAGERDEQEHRENVINSSLKCMVHATPPHAQCFGQYFRLIAVERSYQALG